MIIITDYQIVRKNDFLYIITSEPRICPDCSSELRIRDTKNRTVITSEGKVIFKLRRLKCPHCGKTHTEIPSCIFPYKRYSRNFIEQTANGCVENCPAENSTIYRWRQEKEQHER